MSAERPGTLLILSGPSGAGKDTVMNQILERQSSFGRVVTTTSRPPRPGEVPGIDYNFVTRKQFEAMIEADQFLEFVMYGDDYKGTPKIAVANILDGEKTIWRIDMSATARVESLFKEKFPEETAEQIIDRTVVVLIGVKRLVDLIDRSRKREGNFNRQEFLKRLRADWQVWSKNTFPNVVINEDDRQDDTVDQILQLVANH